MITDQNRRACRPCPRVPLAAIAAVSWLLAACGANSFCQESAPSAPPPGFTAIFNGRDLAGWKGLVADPPQRARMTPEQLAAEQVRADERMRAHWRVENGVLVFDGQGENLCTARDYEDFELRLDWKIAQGGDSGIYLRGSPQVQIWDNPVGSGGLYNNQQHRSTPLVIADRPVGEWNTFRIFMVGERVTVYLNDVLVVDDVPLENYWQREQPIYPRGTIELQNHGGPLWFRNIFVRELSRCGAADSAAVLRRGDRVAIVGDSITEQKLYSRYIEDYLLACVPELDLSVCQFGWGGERAPGFQARLENDLLPFKPTLVTLCFGMNDGSYRPYEPAIGQAYEEATRAIVQRLLQAGARVVVGSPGAVDTFTFRPPGLAADVYNDNLAHLRDISRELSRETGQTFANVHDHMVLAMRQAKPALGEAYHVCGGDGFHPAPNGQLVMAYAFLKALGCDGRIGTITLEASGGASTSAGHKVLSAANGKIELESTRYPFCFFGDDKSPDSTRSILTFVPFNADLNRFMLIVNDLQKSGATVIWGGVSKKFTREQLAAGVNLAAEFLDNPFTEPFRKLDDAVLRKQVFETQMVKEGITWFRSFRRLIGDDPAAEAAMQTLRDRLLSKYAQLQTEVRALVTPVRHTLVVEPAD